MLIQKEDGEKSEANMANYFLDGDNGNDLNAGTSVALSWKTFTKAFGSAGIKTSDTLYVKAGIYQGSFSLVNFVRPNAETFVIGDTNGDFFNVKGRVIISAFNGNNASSGSTLSALDMRQRSFMTFENIDFRGGGNALILMNTATPFDSMCQNIKFKKCFFYSISIGLQLVSATSASFVNLPQFNILIDQCVFQTRNALVDYGVTLTTSSYDYNLTLQNSIVYSGGILKRTVANRAGVANGVNCGGLKLYNNTFFMNNSSNIVNIQRESLEHPAQVFNNLFINGQTIYASITTSSVISNFNKYANCTGLNGAGSFATLGENDIFGGDPGIDFGNSFLIQSVNYTLGNPIYSNYISGQASYNPIPTAVIPKVDMSDNTRPFINSGMMTSPAIGALESADAYKLTTSEREIGRTLGWASIKDKLISK